MPPGNGVMHVRHGADGVDGALGHLQQSGAVVAEDEHVAATHGVGGDAGGLLDDELAVHDGHAPEALLAEALGRLEAVAEEARALAEADALFGFDAGVAGRAGARQHALADAVLELRPDRFRREAEQQHAHAGAPVRRLLGLQFAVDADLGAAADDRGAEAAHGDGRLARPAGRVGGDDDARAAHAEGLGERIVDCYAVDLHDAALALRRLHDDLAAAAVDDLVVAERGSSPCAPCGSDRSSPSAASRSTRSYSGRATWVAPLTTLITLPSRTISSPFLNTNRGVVNIASRSASSL